MTELKKTQCFPRSIQLFYLSWSSVEQSISNEANSYIMASLRYISSYGAFVHHIISFMKYSFSFLFSFRFFQYLAEIYIKLFFSTFISVKNLYNKRRVWLCLLLPQSEFDLPSRGASWAKKKWQKRDSKPGPFGPEARMIPLDQRPLDAEMFLGV